MNMKKILSTALLVVMLFTAIAVVIPPVEASAAHTPSTSVSEADMSLEEIQNYISNEYLLYNFSTAEEMLSYELEKGYLDSSTTADGLYSIYVNRYSGFLYYRNNFSGQILTSNPINPGYQNTDPENLEVLASAEDIMSQISVQLEEVSVSSNKHNYNSVKWAAKLGQISVSAISGGLRVSYTLGDTSTRFLLPGAITAKDFTTDILTPMILTLEEEFEKAVLEDQYKGFFGNNLYDRIEKDGHIDPKRLENYLNTVQAATDKVDKFYDNYILPLKTMISVYTFLDPGAEGESPEYIAKMAEKYPILAEGVPVWYYDMNTDNAKKRQHEGFIEDFCPEYSMTAMYEDEKECGYVHVNEQKLVVRCALEYTFNEDGTLSVRLPANSISFDESVYTLKTVTPLQYFGYGDMTTDGFIFFPDGSGTVINFNDFHNEDEKRVIPLSVQSNVFGHDYCYATLSGRHREQITMPVYGVVTESNTNATTKSALVSAGITDNEMLETGYFAILEEGASLANLQYSSGGPEHKFGSVYAAYEPYPSDEYDLSQTLSVGDAKKYTIVAESKYTGSYITRITMLMDEAVGGTFYGEGNYYETSYVGMASYYRNYLKADGTLSAIELVSDDIPLYIESLGSMTITEKILTFPIEKSIPLTSFDDVITMYNEISNAKEHIEGLIESCRTTSEAEAKELEEDDKPDLAKEVRENAAKKIAEYEELLTKVQEKINNINFKLTGFANDGMYYTYPSKVKWERACGGKKGFANLASVSNEISKEKDVNFSVFPEFDFLYVTNTAPFDGISKNKSLSRMVDNRYASKQVYNEVLQAYESFFTMVVSSDSLDELYSDFLDDYGKYDIDTLSVSTLGSDINSNFDKDNSINRDQSRENVIALLDRMANTDGYELMIDKGNIYSVKYATHILNVATDSSHLQMSSYSVPFVGMILHGHVNYASTPLNYSGSLEYEVLRSIENGAAPYFILCYQNTSHLKDDEVLNDYYGVNYSAWYAQMLITYTQLNSELAGLQDFEIVNHQTVIAERAKEADELLSNYNDIEDEYIANLKAELDAKLDAKFDELKLAQDYTTRINVTFDTAKVAEQFSAIAAATGLTFNAETFAKKLDEVVATYVAEYPEVEGATHATIAIAGLDDPNYESKYSYTTSSDCLAGDEYNYTDYTLDNGKVVIVTYKKGNEEVRFLLNFNIYTVNVNVDGKIVTLNKYQYQNLNELEVDA
ncbi:MAG: hypothetical protein IJ515_04460 [Clostridia bacterium]|nr:hypothetical protein [Clostridia bacterium]